MITRKITNRGYIRYNYLTKVSFGESGSVPIDQSPAKDFNIDPNTGRPMSDIQRLVRMQNDATMQAYFAQLQDFKANYLPSDVSDADALKFLCPRLSQLPSELLDYKEGFAKYQIEQQRLADLAKENELKEKKEKEYYDKLVESLKDSKS